jgi:hypothetical protein
MRVWLLQVTAQGMSAPMPHSERGAFESACRPTLGMPGIF